MSKPIIVAVDEVKSKSFKEIVDSLDNDLCMIKVGSVSFNAMGHEAINYVASKGFKIFLDLKLHDIPNTCVSAIKAVKDLKIDYLTIHISSGLKALISAKKVSGKTKLVGVTVLTSLDNKALKQIGHKNNVKKLVLQQAKLASKAKLDAIVCSAQEIKIVRKVFKKEIITPGIRINKDKNDQKRILTPNQAYKNGSDWLVIGRPITRGNIKKNIQKLLDHINK